MTTPNQEPNITALPPSDRALIVLNSTKTEADLRELVEKSTHITAVIDPAGREQAHRAGMNLKNARIAIEKTGKAAREDAAAFQGAVIAEQKRLIALTEAEEKRIFGLRDTFDAKLAAEKAEKERIERERVAKIRRTIDAIVALPYESRNDPAEQIASTLADLQAMEMTAEGFDEFLAEALAAQSTTMTELSALHTEVKAREEAAARAAAERAELERQRREQEEREAQAKAAQEEQARKLAEERAAFEREKAAFEAQQRAQAEAEAKKAEEERRAAEELAQREEGAKQLREEGDPLAAALLEQDDRFYPATAWEKAAADAAITGTGAVLVQADGSVTNIPAAELAETAAPAEAIQACTKHAWLHDEPQTGACEECAQDASVAATLANEGGTVWKSRSVGFSGPARTYTADDIRAAFIAGCKWDGFEPGAVLTQADMDEAAAQYVAALEG